MIAGSEALVEIESNDSEVRKKKVPYCFYCFRLYSETFKPDGSDGSLDEGGKGGGGMEKNNLLREL